MSESKPYLVTYSYDEKARLTGADYGQGGRIAYTYDPAGNLVRVAVAASAPAPAPPPLQQASGPTPPAVPRSPSGEIVPPPRPSPPPVSPSPPPRAPKPDDLDVTTKFEATIILLPLILSAEGGPLAGHRYTLVKEGTLGRQPGNDIVLDDQGVSRRHASFVRIPGGRWTVTDLGSSNGTLVNGEAIKVATELSPGDTVQVGTTVLRVLPR